MSIVRNGRAIIHHTFTPHEHPAPHDWENHMYEVPSIILQFCERGDDIVIWSYASGGGGHRLSVAYFHARCWVKMVGTASASPAAMATTIPAELSWPSLGPEPARTFHGPLPKC